MGGCGSYVARRPEPGGLRPIDGLVVRPMRTAKLGMFSVAKLLRLTRVLDIRPKPLPASAGAGLGRRVP